tara:strand:- start:2369 stop:2533 length:165 start_codon:yes stop_codon:yes gene_type:complete
MWIIKRPDGNTYTRKDLKALKAGYGHDKEGLEAKGWKFTKVKSVKEKDKSNEDD